MTMFRHAIATILTATALALPIAGHAASAFENIDALEQRLVTALDVKIGQPGGPVAAIDRRLKLQACPAHADIDPPALGAVAIRCPALGWRIRVPLLREAGAPSDYAQRTAVAPAARRAEPLVRRGDPVELQAQRPGFSISAQGIAQDDGGAGERVRVKIDPKGSPIYAEVVDRGLVIISSLGALN